MAMFEVNQDSDCSITISFYDDKGKSVAPITARYRVVDVNSRAILKADTEISPVAAVVTIVIPATVNALIDKRLKVEPKALTLYYTYDDGHIREVTSEFDYFVAKLHGRNPA